MTPEKETLRMRVLTMGDRGLKRGFSTNGSVDQKPDERRNRIYRRKGSRRYDVGQPVILRILRIWLRVIHEVTVEVDVILVDPPQMRETVRVDGVNHYHLQVRTKSCRKAVAQKPGLNSGARKALNTVCARPQHQNGLRISAP